MFSTGQDGVSSVLNRAIQKLGKVSVALMVVAATGVLATSAVHARTAANLDVSSSVPLLSLPEQAQATHRLILTGGPFRYGKDGVVFGNRERLLPPKARGFYREYTVKTPGSKDRGARRIVCGGAPPTQPEACFYSDDHYASFRRIAP